MQRRLAAIMMLDMIGYGRLAEKNETAALRTLKMLRKQAIEPQVEIAGGRILKLMGDGVMMEFPSIVSAVTCGLAIQELAAKALAADQLTSGTGLRIGINLCDLIEDDGDIYGEDVNIAARLEQSAPPGAVRITSEAYRQVRNKTEATALDRGAITLKNIREAVAIHDLFPTTLEPVTDLPEEKTPWLAPAKKPAIAVLPFDNLGSNPDDNYYGEGISEDIITELSKFHSLDVLARHSSFAFKGQQSSIGALGQKLGVDYIVEGSVRRQANRIRLVAQLIEVASGKHIWAETYSEEATAIFAIEDRIVSKVVGQLEKSLLHERLRHSVRSKLESAQPYDLWLKAKRLMEDWTPDSDFEAEKILESCLELDPEFARAYSGLAGILMTRILLMPGIAERKTLLLRGLDYAKQAVELDPNDGQIHINLAWAYMQTGNHRRGERHFDLAEQMNPNDASILIASALGAAFLGDPDSGRQKALRAMELNPLHPDYYLGNLAMIEYTAGDFKACLEAIAAAPTSLPEIAGWQAAALAMAGRTAEAKGAAEGFRHSIGRSWKGPHKPEDRDLTGWLLAVNPYSREEDRKRLIAGLEAAGLDCSGLTCSGLDCSGLDCPVA